MNAKSLLIIPMVLTLFSCNQELKSEKKTPQKITTKQTATETNFEYSKRMARIGESMVNIPNAISNSHYMFDLALKSNPNNNKALFYSAFTEIVMSMRGSVSRGKSLMDDTANYDKFLDHLTNKVKYPEFVDFMVGSTDQSKFNNYQDIKRFVQTEVVEAFETAHKKLNRINGSVDVILTQLKTQNTEEEVNCKDVVDEGYTYKECDIVQEMTDIQAIEAKTATVDLNDIKMLAGGLKGYSTALKLYTAYSIEGQKHITNEIKVKEMELERSLTDKELHRVISRYSNYLTLENDHKMNEIAQDLESIVETGMDLEALNNRFCDNELRSNNLIKTICFSEESRRDMQKSLDYLSGPQEIVLGQDANGSDVNILIDLPGYLNNPVRDLKSLMPTEYNEDGSSNNTSEPNLNGLFPNNDLLEKSKLVKSE